MGKRLGKANFWKSYKEEYRSLWKLGSPVLVTQLGIITVSFADTMMVGAYGVDELASAAFVNNLFMVAIVAQIGFSLGLTPLVGALFGQGNRKSVGTTLRAGLEVNILFSLFVTLLMGVLYFFIDRMGQPDELMGLIRPYYLIVLSTLLPMAVFNSFQQTANGCTDTALPMWVILGCNVMNIAGNYCLIFGKFGFPEMGLSGAGISTLASRYAGMIAIILLMLRARRYREMREGFHLAEKRGKLRMKVFNTSYPVMIQNAVECSLWSVGAVVCGWFGKIQLASFQVVNTTGQLGFMTYLSFGTATSIKVANYMGVEDYTGVRRITHAGLHLNLLLCTLMSAVILISGRHLVNLFTPDADVVANSLTLLLPLALYQYMDSVQLTYCNALRGTSVVKPLLWVSVISYLGVGIPSMLLFAVTFDLGNMGVYYSFNVALAVASVLLALAFYRTLSRKIIGLEGRQGL